MKHLQEVGESYFKHLMVTVKVASRLTCAAASQLIHGLLPNVKPPFNNNLTSIIDFLSVHRSEIRTVANKDDEELYINYGGD